MNGRDGLVKHGVPDAPAPLVPAVGIKCGYDRTTSQCVSSTCAPLAYGPPVRGMVFDPPEHGEASQHPLDDVLLVPCPTIEDDDQMVRAYEAIARQRAEYVPRFKACLEEVVRLREMRRYIFRQSRALAQQMLADTGIRATEYEDVLGNDGEPGPLDDLLNHSLSGKKRARLETGPDSTGLAQSDTKDTRCRTFGCTLSTHHAGVHRFDRFADPPLESFANESVQSSDADVHALLDVPINAVRDGLLKGLRSMARQPHATPFLAAASDDVFVGLDTVVARLERWEYDSGQQLFTDLEVVWSGAIHRCATDSWMACYAHKLQGETETLRKTTVQLVKDAVINKGGH